MKAACLRQQAIYEQIGRLRNGRRGVILVITAMIFPVMLAFLGLALDVGVIFDLKRRQQAAADAGAMGAAHELFRGNSDLVTDAARNDAAINGFAHYGLSGGNPDVTVTVNYPYTFNGQTGFVEVINEERDVPTTFLRVVGQKMATVQSRAVAGLVRNYGDGCVFALNPTMKFALKMSGQGTLLANCGIMVNSNSPRAIDLSMQACLKSNKWIGTGGGFDSGGSACYSPYPTQYAMPMYDPMAYMAQPPIPLAASSIFGDVQVTAALCENQTPSSAFTCDNGTYVWEPGQYGILRANTGNHVFNAGIYVITRRLAFTTGGTITGTEVGFYGTERDGSKWMGMSVTAQSTVDFSAPTSGPMKGILVWVDRSMPYKTVKFEGGVDSRWKGTFYLPSQHLDFGGHTNADGDWVYIIADNIDVHGQGFVSQLDGPTTATPGAPDVFKVTLME